MGPEKQEAFSSPEALLQSSELQAPSLLSAQGQGKLRSWHSEEGGQERGEQSGEKESTGERPQDYRSTGSVGLSSQERER